MLSTERVLQELNELMGNYESFAQIAVEIPWIQVEAEHIVSQVPTTLAWTSRKNIYLMQEMLLL